MKLIGVEKIKVNGEIVSQKFSVFGTEHNFTIKENDENVECKIDLGFGFHGVVFSLYKNNIPIVESPKKRMSIFSYYFVACICIWTSKRLCFLIRIAQK